MAEEYWRWPESRWTDPELDWKGGDVISGGVDVGSVSSQAVVLAGGRLYCYGAVRTGASSPDSAARAMDLALEGTGLALADLEFVVGTGYGRVNVPFAKRTVTEIACHGRGANFIYGDAVRTVLDVGGQDCKVIHCDARGKPTNFIMNDKCAAGAGRGLEVFADLVQTPVAEIGELSLQAAEEPPPISSNCVVFAKSEALGLLRGGWSREMVLAAYCQAMAHRAAELLERLGVEEAFVVTGGVAKNRGVVERIERELGVKALKPGLDPQIAGALGAALFAKALAEKKRRKKK